MIKDVLRGKKEKSLVLQLQNLVRAPLVGALSWQKDWDGLGEFELTLGEITTKGYPQGASVRDY